MKIRRQRLRQLERRITALEALLTPSEVRIEIAPRAIAPEDWQRLGEFTRRHRNNPPATMEADGRQKEERQCSLMAGSSSV